MNDDQWLQASLPVRNGGLGIRNATKLAPSVFLASAASTRSLQDAILPQCFRALEDISQTQTMAIWKSLSSAEVLASRLQHVQKAWDELISSKIQTEILGTASDVNYKARLLAVASPHWRLVTRTANQLHWSYTSQQNDPSLCWPETRRQNLWTTHLPFSKDGRSQRITWPFVSQKYSKTTRAFINTRHNSQRNLANTDPIKKGTSWTRT